MDPAEYVRLFNSAVLDGHWTSILEQFTDDAVLEFVGPPVGPYVGKSAIAAAYETSPPDDQIEVAGPVSVQGETLLVSYRWCSTGAGGTMRFTEREGLIENLVVTFD